jgi:GDP-fucose transporter C1
MSAIILIPFSFLSGEISEIFSTVWFWDEVGFWIQMVRM